MYKNFKKIFGDTENRFNIQVGKLFYENYMKNVAKLDNCDD